ncbi:unnamed protein product [Aspergillus oryzae]|nr:unnamed protein product [Aspergillus oryzae]
MLIAKAVTVMSRVKPPVLGSSVGASSTRDPLSSLFLTSITWGSCEGEASLLGFSSVAGVEIRDDTAVSPVCDDRVLVDMGTLQAQCRRYTSALKSNT